MMERPFVVFFKRAPAFYLAARTLKDAKHQKIGGRRLASLMPLTRGGLVNNCISSSDPLFWRASSNQEKGKFTPYKCCTWSSPQRGDASKPVSAYMVFRTF